MTEIGLYFSSSTGNCANIAGRIAEKFDPIPVKVYDIIHDHEDEVGDYDYLIFGIPTWECDELHIDWKEFLPRLEKSRLKRKNVALFGLGDQETYSDSFANSLGQLHAWLSEKKVRFHGYWPMDGYNFARSAAVKNDRFVGLVLDEDNQSALTEKRLTDWVNQLRHEFFGY